MAISTKVNALILVPVIFVPIVREIWLGANEAKKNGETQKDGFNLNYRLKLNLKLFTNNLVKKLPNLIFKLALCFGMIGLLFGFTYYLYFSIAKDIIPKNSYSTHTSPETKLALESNQTQNVGYFAVQLQDHLNFSDKFQNGRPKMGSN